MSEFKFTIVILAYNVEKTLEECIKSVLNQTFKLRNTTEIILVNDGSTDRTHEICEDFALKYPNIRYISKNHEGKGTSKNLGIMYAKGEYIHFLDGEDYLSRNALSEVLDMFKKYDNIDVVTIPMKYLNKDFENPFFDEKYKSTRVINLFETPELIQMRSNPCFIKRSSLEHVRFSKHITLPEDLTFINKILLNNPNLGICSEAIYFNRNSKGHNELLNYIPHLKNSKNRKVNFYLDELIEESKRRFGKIPLFIQKVFLEYFNVVIANETIDEKLTKNEIRILNGKFKEDLQYIDDESIFSQGVMDDKIKTFLFYLKNNYSYPEEDQITLTKRLKLDTLYVDIYEIINDELHILANINSISKDEKIDVYINNEKIEVKTINFPQRERYYLNEKYLNNHTIEFYYKLDNAKKYTLKFKSNINDNLNIDFSRPCNFSKAVGYAKTKRYLSYLIGNEIKIEKKTTTKWIKKEIKTLFGMLKNRVPGFETAIPLRIIYMILYPFLRNKHIWFYMDFPTIADDNGMHLFKYSIKQDDKNIKKYFIIDKNTPYYRKMKKIGPTIAYHSMKHRILGLYAEKIITSHPDNNYIYAFWGHYPNFTGILKSSTIFLQHGITLNNISNWLNKYDKNLDFLLTASKKEYDSLFKYYYNYDEDIIHLLGFPRFDNLKDEKTKTILLMPSWRRYLTNENKYTISNSSYFKTYNSLINNEKLIQKAEEYGYEIIFRPHPHVYQFIELFDENDYIKIDLERGSYQDLFKKGALMVTDYSSVAFDFAYLKKPVLYYQYGEDYHFNLEESYFDYETMGFGEVCETEDELVDLIVDYMENDCEMKEKHVQNVEEYFTFTDKNNCMRVHDAIKKVRVRD